MELNGEEGSIEGVKGGESFFGRVGSAEADSKRWFNYKFAIGSRVRKNCKQKIIC